MEGTAGTLPINELDASRVTELTGSAVLVAGASSGIGRATALAFARAGARVALLARREPELRALADEIRAESAARVTSPTKGAGGADSAGTANDEPLVLAADLADGVATRRAVERVVQAFGRLDVVIYAAGTNTPRRALTVLEPAVWDELMGANLSGAYHVTQASLPAMRAQAGGLLIYLSSAAVQKPDVSGVAYQATKHGLIGLAHGTFQEEREHGVRTTVIFPGLTETPLLAKRPVPTPPEIVAKALQPEDVARTCVFVASLPDRVRVPEMQLVPSAL